MLVPLSPNNHDQFVAFELVSVNVTVNGTIPDTGVPLNVDVV
jgi:hypothetical protein